MIRVLVVDDHPAIGTGTKAIIEKQADMKADFIVDSGGVLEKVQQEKHDIYLIDLYMTEFSGIELTAEILQVNPEAVILIYTGFDIMIHYNLLIDSGVTGFVSKTATAEQLITSIRCALRDEVVVPLQLLKQLRRVETVASADSEQPVIEDLTLSSIEQTILEKVSKGKTNKIIAVNLNMSQRAIEYHLTKVFSKLNVESRTEAVIKAQQFGLLSVQKINKE